MARDDSPKIRQQAQLSRKLNQRASYERILIVSEGSKTEPLYFKEIREKFRLHTANVQAHPSELGTEPMQVVQYARNLFEHGDTYKKVRPRAFEHVFAVFDRDDHRTYFDALRLAASLDGDLRNDARQAVKFYAIASVPSFELWLLLHFEDIQQPIHRNEVMGRLKQYIPRYDKGTGGNYTITHRYIELAMSRAQKLAERSNEYNGGEPYTAVGRLVELLHGLGKR